MTVSSSDQMTVFLWSLISGALCGIIFDWMRSVRKIFGCSKCGIIFQDMVFSAVCAFFAVGVCYRYNKGSVRYFEILGLIGGVLFYGAIFSNSVMKAFCIINKLVMAIIIKPTVKLVCHIVRSLNNFYLFLYKKIKKISVFLNKKIKKTYQKRKKLKKRCKML